MTSRETSNTLTVSTLASRLHYPYIAHVLVTTVWVLNTRKESYQENQTRKPESIVPKNLTKPAQHATSNNPILLYHYHHYRHRSCLLPLRSFFANAGLGSVNEPRLLDLRCPSIHTGPPPFTFTPVSLPRVLGLDPVESRQNPGLGGTNMSSPHSAAAALRNPLILGSEKSATNELRGISQTALTSNCPRPPIVARDGGSIKNLTQSKWSALLVWIVSWWVRADECPSRRSANSGSRT